MVIPVALAAGLGSVCRYLVINFSRRWEDYPVADLIINILGCFLAGLFSVVVPPSMRPIAMAGFCGGYTTYSTFMLDTVILKHNGQSLRSLVHFVLTILLSVAAMLVGMTIVN